MAQTASGLCGCGDTAADADQDGVPDCMDVCPKNPTVKTPGKVTFQLTFTEGAQSFSQYFTDITSCVTAAGAKWASKFPVPHDVSIEVLVDFIDLNGGVASAGPSSTVLADAGGTVAVYQIGTIHEFLTGVDPNGGDADMLINFDRKAISQLWFDPDPRQRTSALPQDSVDAESVCLHEMGHALGFFSFRDSKTNTLKNNRASYYDFLSNSPDGTNYIFQGPKAVEAYGSPVPETRGSWSHIGNATDPGRNLLGTLMYAYAQSSARQYIGPLEVAILRDIGLPVPGSAAIDKICASAGTLGSSHHLPNIILGPKPVPIP